MDRTGIRHAAAALAALLLLAAGVRDSRGLVFDFEDLQHGEIALGTRGILDISAHNPNRSFDLAVGFDSRLTGTRDPDLEAGPGGWSGGNLAGADLGVLLVLQENSIGCGDGICDAPDDEGRRPAGELVFRFSTPVRDFRFDAVDIEGVMAERASITFYDGTRQATLDLLDFLDPGSPFYDPSLVFGDRTANRFPTIRAQDLGLPEIDRIVFAMGGSGALDNLTVTPVPEPSTALILGLGLAVLAQRRRCAAEGRPPRT